MPKPKFELPRAPVLDLGSLRDVHAFQIFIHAWRSKAKQIAIIGAAGSKRRKACLRLRAEAVMAEMVDVGPGAESIDAIIKTAQHLATTLGEAAVMGSPPDQLDVVHLVPSDETCAVCGSAELELMASSRRPAKLLVRGLDGARPGRAYKLNCCATDEVGQRCGTVHRYNEIEVPAGKRLRDEPAEAEGSAMKRRCVRPDILKQEFFRATKRTVYTSDYMEWTTALLETTQAAFDGVTRATRSVHRELEGTLDRTERKNMATAWFAREAIAAAQEAKVPMPTADALGIAARSRKSGNAQQKTMLRKLLPAVRTHFRKLNLKGHRARCLRPGRDRAAVVDGLHLLCWKCATPARHYKLLGRWGQVALGCTNPPAPGSSYCEECLQQGGLRTPQADDPEQVGRAQEMTRKHAAEVAAAAKTLASPEATSEEIKDAQEAMTKPEPRYSMRTTTVAQREAFVAHHAGKASQAEDKAAVSPKDEDGEDEDGEDDGAEPVEDESDDEAQDACAAAGGSDDEEDSFAGRYLERSVRGSRAHEPIRKDIFLLEDIVGADVSNLGIPMLLVKWVEWKHPTWEPREHIPPLILKEYELGKPFGKAKYPSMLPDPSAPILELTPYEKEVFGNEGSCTTFKEEQKRWSKYANPDMNGAKGKARFTTTVRNTDAGQSAFVRSCNLIGDLQPMYKKESISGIVSQVWQIYVECPELFPPDEPTMNKMPTVGEKRKIAQATLDSPSPELAECLVAWFYDDGCHLSYSIMLRAVGKLAKDKPTDSVEAVFYRRLLRLIICVDRMHFKNHIKTDEWCQQFCNPALYEDVLGNDGKVTSPGVINDENSEAAEQTFAWLGRFKSMVRTMGQERAYFLLIRMAERHNRRTIADTILELGEPALLELCAAYGQALKDDKSEPFERDELKRRLIKTLIAGERRYDLDALRQHQAARKERERESGEGSAG